MTLNFNSKEKREQLIKMGRAAAAAIPAGEWRDDILRSIDLFAAGQDRARLYYLLMLKKYPVSVEQFLFGKEYLNREEVIWPELMPALIETCNPDGDRLGLKYYEAVLTGGIGVAKTQQATYGLAHQIYLLSCYRDPHLLLGQDPSAEIMFIFQSLNGKVARDGYTRFRELLGSSQYFRDNFDFRRDIESKMIFPHRIEVAPVTGEVTATIGQNVLGGLIDEVNFMMRTEKSKKATNGGDFDQALELYNSIDSRRRSRFMDMGVIPGRLYLCSSKNYPGQFTDKKRDQARTNPNIYYSDVRVWELRPNKFSGKKFWLFLGDTSRRPFIVDEKHPAPRDAKAKGLLDQIPVEYIDKFREDIYQAMREIAGHSTLATSPYMPNTEAIAAAFRKSVRPIIMPDIVDFSTTLPLAYPSHIFNKDEPRAVHIDLAINGDIAGVSCGMVEKFRQIEDEGEIYHMPMIRYDFTLGVAAPPQDEIQFNRIRKLVSDLRDRFGLNIRWVSFDTFQSRDSQQILKQRGFIAGEVSMDVTSDPYDMFKTAINQGRIIAPFNEDVKVELMRLERDKDGKVDHPAGGSKDRSDAMAGVCYVLTTRKEIWYRHGVQPRMPIRDRARRMGESV